MVYIVHFERPLHHARHYVGQVDRPEQLEKRIQEHRAGRGARILEACNQRKILYRVVRTFKGGRTKERALKNRKETPRYCPVCNPEKWERYR
ncbi:MAG: endonuclease [Lewinellaceae bacterium]|nr:endonuclease [Lewinellaceae bacterium]